MAHLAKGFYLNNYISTAPCKEGKILIQART